MRYQIFKLLLIRDNVPFGFLISEYHKALKVISFRCYSSKLFNNIKDNLNSKF